MVLENIETLDFIVKTIITILSIIAGIIGAFFNQRMIKTEVKTERNLVPTNYHRKRIRLWFKMHTTSWWIFIICSLLIIPLTFLQNFLDGKIEKATTAESEEKQNRRDSLLQANYFNQILELRKENSFEQQRHEDSLKTYGERNTSRTKAAIQETAYEMTKIFAENSKDNKAEHKKTQEKVSNIKANQEGVIAIGPGEDLVTIDTLENELHANLILCNDGNIPAKNVNVEAWKVNKKDNTDKKYIASMRADFSDGRSGQHDCWTAHYIYSKEHDLKAYFICYKITYTDPKGNHITEIKAVMYSYDLRKWAVSATDFNWLFSK